jgi:hypothetical protein
MSRSKPAPLSNRAERSRDDTRQRVSIEARCRAADREIQDVLVMDLGQSGCRLLGVAAGITKSDPLQVWLGDAGPFAARLCWAKRGSLGVEFDEPLDETLVSRLADATAQPNVVAMRRPRSG